MPEFRCLAWWRNHQSYYLNKNNAVTTCNHVIFIIDNFQKTLKTARKLSSQTQTPVANRIHEPEKSHLPLECATGNPDLFKSMRLA
jgi:hypothetical protein